MRILVLGATGMLGHELVQTLALTRHEVHAAVRTQAVPALAGAAAIFPTIDARDFDRVQLLLASSRPHAVVNAVSVTHPRAPGIDDTKEFIEVNALFPHRLADACRGVGARLVHIGTDAVFSGNRGGSYTEIDSPDPVDLYGQTRALGDVTGARVVTLRASLIGLELRGRRGLVETMLRQQTPIAGQRRMVSSAITTRELSRVIARVLTMHLTLEGIWHVAAEPISHYDLLCRLAERLPWRGPEITAESTVIRNRSLCGTAFARATGYSVPSWDSMLDDLAHDIQGRAGEHIAS